LIFFKSARQKEIKIDHKTNTAVEKAGNETEVKKREYYSVCTADYESLFKYAKLLKHFRHRNAAKR